MINNEHIDKVTYQITIGSTTINKGLVALSVTDSLNRIPKARLELNYRDIGVEEQEKNYQIEQASSFDQEEQSTDTTFLPGESITIELGTDNSSQQVFTGYITKQHIVAKNNGVLMLYVDCKHAANKMTLATRTRFLHEASNSKKIETIDDDTILTEIVRQYEGISLTNVDSAIESFSHENIVQYNCSDWDFLVMRAEATGRVCKVTEQEIQLIEPQITNTVANTLVLGKHIFEYEAEYDETKIAKDITVSSWKIDEKEAQEEQYPNETANKDASKIQDSRYFNHRGDLESDETKAWATNKINRQELGKVLGSVKTFGTTEITIGDSINISGFNSVWDRDTLVSGIKHVVKKGTWHTYLQCGLSSLSHAQIFDIHATANPNELLPSSNGLLYGKVIGYKESTGGHELIEVQILSANESTTNQNIYARLATPSAGEKGGFVFRPYPNDEVVIGFINNDPRFPVVLGSLYNSQNEYPYALNDDEQTEIGFAFNFSDDKAKAWKINIHQEDETMTIASPNGQSFLLDDKAKSIAMAFDDSNGITITSEGIEMDASKIVMKGSQGIELEGMKIEAKADTSMKLEGGTQLELEGKVTASLKGQITQIN